MLIGMLILTYLTDMQEYTCKAPVAAANWLQSRSADTSAAGWHEHCIVSCNSLTFWKRAVVDDYR
jgi:hypothetical protein